MEGAKEDLGGHLQSFSPLRQVAMPGEAVGLAILDAGAIDDGVLVVVDFLGPAGLTMGEDASGLEVFKVLVVSDDSERLSETLQIVPPELDGGDDGKELLVVDLVVALGRRHLAGKEGDWVEESGGLDLGEDGGDGVVGGVGFDDGFEGRVEMA